MQISIIVSLFLSTALFGGGCAPSSGTRSGAAARSPAQRFGTTFLPYDPDRDSGIRVRRIEIPDFPGNYAIWGGTGRDDRGNIWIGVCASGVPEPSARAYWFDPRKEELFLDGDVVQMLKLLRVARPKEGQMKIHSKFVPMDDGYLYFASMDEEGENEDGSRLPTWGSHLWRLRPGAPQWEKLLTVPEGLIAVTGVGRYLFTLGYFGHVVYRYDTRTGDLQRTEVGSYKGHISRNFLADGRGHVFVPRIVELLPANAKEKRGPLLVAQLVELDQDLIEIAATTLNHYPADGSAQTHGITGIAYLADQSMAFTSSDGFLYRLVPREGQPTELEELGWFHPDGTSYAPSLFALDGSRYLAGITAKKGGSDFDWVIYDLDTKLSSYKPFPIKVDKEKGISGLLLYGSVTRDDAGNAYVVGQYTDQATRRERPICLQIQIGERGGEIVE